MLIEVRVDVDGEPEVRDRMRRDRGGRGRVAGAACVVPTNQCADKQAGR